MSVSHTALVALGSNVGDRQAHLGGAVLALRGLGRVEAISSLYESPAVELPTDASDADRQPYLNACVRLTTFLPPEALLAGLLSVETFAGRPPGRGRGHHRARTLDLDLVVYDDWVSDGRALRLPHPGLLTRPFVWIPCLETGPVQLPRGTKLSTHVPGGFAGTQRGGDLRRVAGPTWAPLGAAQAVHVPGADLVAEARRQAERDRPPLYVFGETTSTSDVVRRLADFGAPSGTTVVAERQSAGRGRHGRTWHGPPGRGLLLSILLRDIEVAPGLVPIAAGLAVAEAAEAAGSVPVRLKWPNDLLVRDADGRDVKAGGILMERLGDGAIVCGVGLNVFPLAEDAPPEVRARAGSLFPHPEVGQGHGVEGEGRRAFLLRLVRARLAGLPQELAAFGPADVVRRFARRTDMLGHPVTVHETGRAPWSGTALALGEDGSLRVRRPDGREASVHAADVSLTHAPGAAEPHARTAAQGTAQAVGVGDSRSRHGREG